MRDLAQDLATAAVKTAVAGNPINSIRMIRKAHPGLTLWEAKTALDAALDRAGYTASGVRFVRVGKDRIRIEPGCTTKETGNA